MKSFVSICLVIFSFNFVAPAEIDPICPYPSDEITYYPVPGDCTRYIECIDGVKFEYQCSEGLWWHQDILNCDYPGTYCDPSTSTTDGGTTTTKSATSTTTERTTTTQRTTTTTAPITTTTGSNVDPRCVNGETAYWPHPEFCNMYIECYQGNSYEMTCPRGLYFSSVAKKCVDASESDCCTETSSC